MRSLLGSLFSSMAGGALMIPALLVLPAIFAVLLGVGWTREDIIEDSVYELWSSTGSDSYKDRQYADDLGVSGSVTSFLAMAKSRDSNNILSEERLREIRSRMEAVETVKVTHDNHTFTWKDICAQNNIGLGTVYEFPCVRLTPMDFFEEANWFVTEKDRLSWYDKGIYDKIVTPRIVRFGIMSTFCSSSVGGPPVCDQILRLRQNGTYAEAEGYGKDYADPIQLFSDLGRMELNNPCRQCIEPTFEAVVDNLTAGVIGTFKLMFTELNKTVTSLSKATSPNEAKISEIGGIMLNIGRILSKVDRAAIEDMLVYVTTRGLYKQLGASSYLKGFAGLNSACSGCLAPANAQQLLTHADSPFSSHNTFGSPYHAFSENDTTGSTLFFGNAPFGGSGLNLSGIQLSMTKYFDFPTNAKPLYTTSMADPSDTGWKIYVESDPVYKWFMAGETSMTSHCGNEDLHIPPLLAALSTRACTKFSKPLEDEEKTVQHFAKMWYNLLIDSSGFLGISQGVSDPYTWTSGEGCGYSLKGSRNSYSNKNQTDILKAASNQLYYLDEGLSVGALDKRLLMGGTVPSDIDDVSKENPFETVSTIQTVYPALQPKYIPDRVRNCNRPMGAIDITESDAEVVLELFKQAMVDAWTKGWDDDDEGEVKFVGFFDDAGVGGTFSFVLRDITNDNGKLTAISIALIALVSIFFLANCDPVESRIMITLVGVLLVILSFFGALGFGILVGIKININIAWTLPFIIIGLGVDDMYIVLLALKQQNGYTKDNFVAAMKEIVIPVSMTSLVNASMFAIMNAVDIGAIYKTAQAALISVIFLYLTIVFCFPAYCYLDMKRQQAGRRDVFICCKAKINGNNSEGESFLFKKIYKPLVLGGGWLSFGVKSFVVLSTLALFAVGIYGITERQVGLGLREFFPVTHQASEWANIRENDLASWPIGVSWGALNYSNPEEQMKMIKQYEDIVTTAHVSKLGTDTKFLWIADFSLWTTRQCMENFDRSNLDVKECGMDQTFVDNNAVVAADDNTQCSGTWKNNTHDLKDKVFSDPKSDVCSPFGGGICRPRTQMFQEDLINASLNDYSFCPVFEGWSDAKFKFCIEKWREHTGGGGGLLVKENTATPYEDCTGEFYTDDSIQFPIQYSNSPSIFAYNLNTHQATLAMIEETRQLCDYVDGIHCWMTGIPFNYWEQFLSVESVLLKITSGSIAVGFGVATLFLILQFTISQDGYSKKKIVLASLGGATLIAITSILSVIPVIGISILAGVNLTAFSNMAFVLSIGFAVEYSVHVVHRFLSAPNNIRSAENRVFYTMQFLTVPLTLSFVSSTIGISCLAFTEFQFNEVFFFRPLMIVAVVTYYIGTWFLPILLTQLDFDFLKVGSNDARKDGSDLISDTK